MGSRGKPLAVLAQHGQPGISFESAYGHSNDRFFIGLEVRQLLFHGDGGTLQFFIDEEEERDVVFGVAHIQNLRCGLVYVVHRLI